MPPTRHTVFKQGYFKPKNPEKYAGNIYNITYRSSYEFKFFTMLDENQNVVKWSAECFIVKYISPIDQKTHNYYPDVYFELKKGEEIAKFVGEIKASTFLKKPKREDFTNKISYLKKLKIFLVNYAKAEATKKYCAEKGYTYKFITEQTLGV